MEENEDEPEDVRKATPVEVEIRIGEKDETGGNLQFGSKKPKSPFYDEKKRQKNKVENQLVKSEPIYGRGRSSRPFTPQKSMSVFIYSPLCTLPKLEIIPRHCLSKKEYIDMLATSSRKCPSPCSGKTVLRRVRPVSGRMNELARPARRQVMATLQDCGESLPAEMVDNLVKTIEENSCLTPEQAEHYFRDKNPRRCRKSAKRSRKSKRQARKRESCGSQLDEDSVTNQYSMAERFVKSILQWRCSIPTEEFQDIANVILRRLSLTLEYSPVDGKDLRSQQMRFLSDVIACWISGVLFEVAQDHKKEMEEEWKQRKLDAEGDREVEEISVTIDFGDPPRSGRDKDSDDSEEREESEEDEGSEDEELRDGRESADEQERRDKSKQWHERDGRWEKMSRSSVENDGSAVVEAAEESKREAEDDGGKTDGKTEGRRLRRGEREAQRTRDEERRRKKRAAEKEEERRREERRRREEEEEENERKRDRRRREKEERRIKEAEARRQRREADKKRREDEKKRLQDEEEEKKQKEKEEDAKKLKEEEQKKLKEEEEEKLKEEEEKKLKEEEEKKLKEEEEQKLKEEEEKKLKEEEEKKQKEEEEKKLKEEEEKKLKEEEEKKLKEEEEKKLKEEEEKKQKEEEEKKLKEEEEKKLKEEEEKKLKEEEEEKKRKEEEEKLKEESAKDQKEEEGGKKREKEKKMKEVEKTKRKEEKEEEEEERKRERKRRKEVGEPKPSGDRSATYGPVLDVIYKVLDELPTEAETDPVQKRIQRNIYEKVLRRVEFEIPASMSVNFKDVLDVVASKAASWLKEVLMDAGFRIDERSLPAVRSVEIRKWAEWIDDVTEKATDWANWIHKLVEDAEEKSTEQVNRGEWFDWTSDAETDALLWRRYYIETAHQAHRNATMMAGRPVTKTGNQNQPENPFETEIADTNLVTA